MRIEREEKQIVNRYFYITVNSFFVFPCFVTTHYRNSSKYINKLNKKKTNATTQSERESTFDTCYFQYSPSIKF